MYKKAFFVIYLLIANAIYQNVGAAGNILGFLDDVANVTNSSNQSVSELKGEVVKVSDGDTLTVRTGYGDVIVRLFAIDAPEVTCHGMSDNVCNEKGQPGGKASKLKLRELALHRNVVVTLGHGMSKNRVVGQVFLSDGTDVNLAMVESGNAWHYKFFAKQQSADDRTAYAEAELHSKTLKRGIWGTGEYPVPPWQWRKNK